jgi:hypothetical protein
MAIPTATSHGDIIVKLTVQLTVFHHLRYGFTVARYAIVLDPLCGIVSDPQVIAIGAQCHGHRMIEAIFGFGQHFVGKGITRQMTVNATGLLAMRAVLPGRIMGVHSVAVDADLWISGEIGQHLGFIDDIQKQSDHCHNTTGCYILHNVTIFHKQPFWLWDVSVSQA